MTKKLRGSNTELFDQLIRLTTKKVAIEIANIATHCNFASFSIDCATENSGMIVCGEECPEEEIGQLANHATLHGTAIVIISPYKRLSLCNALLKSNRSTSMDRLNYLIFFNNRLPKQHFKL